MTDALPADGARDVPDRSWAPADCTLPTEERPLRAAEFAGLFDDAVTGARRIDPGRLRLTLRRDRDVAAQAADLATAETECCSFFTFTLTIANDSLLLDVAVPPARAAILDALAAQASASGDRG
jgi:hypothetical protein